MRIAMLCFLCKEEQSFLCEANLDKNLLKDIENIFELKLKAEEFKLCLRCFTLSVSLRDINKITTLKRTGCGICSSKNVLNKNPNSYQSILISSITFQVQNFKNAKFCCDCLLQVQNITAIENLYKLKKENKLAENTNFKIKPISILLKRVDLNVHNIDINRIHPQGAKRQNYNTISPRISRDNSISPSTSHEDCSESKNKSLRQSTPKRQRLISSTDDDSVSHTVRTPVPTKRKLSLSDYSNSSQSDRTENIAQQSKTAKSEIIKSSSRRISNRHKKIKKGNNDSRALANRKTSDTRKTRTSISESSNASKPIGRSETSSVSISEGEQNENTESDSSARKMQSVAKIYRTTESVNQEIAILKAEIWHKLTHVTANSPQRISRRQEMKRISSEVLIISSEEEEEEVPQLNKKKQNNNKSELKKNKKKSLLNVLKMERQMTEKKNSKDENPLSPESKSRRKKTDAIASTDSSFNSINDEELNYTEELKKFNSKYSLDMKVPRICISPIEKIYLDEFIRDIANNEVVDDPELQLSEVIAAEETGNGNEEIEASPIVFSENLFKENADKNDSTVEITSNKDDDSDKDPQSSSKFIIDKDDTEKDDTEKDDTGKDDSEKEDTGKDDTVKVDTGEVDKEEDDTEEVDAEKDNENHIKSPVEFDNNSEIVQELKEKHHQQTLDTETQEKESEITQAESEKIHSNKENNVDNTKPLLENFNNDTPIVSEDVLPEDQNAALEDTDKVNTESCTSIETGEITENIKDKYDDIIENMQDKFDGMIEKTTDKYDEINENIQDTFDEMIGKTPDIEDNGIDDVYYHAEETINNSSKESTADINNTQTKAGDITDENNRESTIAVELNKIHEIEEAVTRCSPSHIVQNKSNEVEVDGTINNGQDTEPNTDINYEGDSELTPEIHENRTSDLTPEINEEGGSKSTLETSNVDHTAQNIGSEPDSTTTEINTVSLEVSKQNENDIESSDNEKIILEDRSASDNDTDSTVAKEPTLKDDDIFSNDTTGDVYFDTVIDADDDFDIFSIDVTGEKNKAKSPS